MRVLLIALLFVAGSAFADKPVFQVQDVFLINYASQPQVSPDGSFVIYSHNSMDIMEDRRRSNLWRVDSDGSNARPLTTGAVNDGGARISPDSERVAYVSRDDKGGQIFVRWLESGETQQLTRLPYSPGNLRWSPDGEWLAFSQFVPSAPATMGKLPPAPKGAKWADANSVVDRAVFRFDGAGEIPPGATHIYVIPSSGGAPRKVTGGDINFNGAISWAKDGESLFVTGIPLENAIKAPQDNSIYRVSLASGELEQVIERDGPENNVSVSPDGKKILFSGYDDGRMSWQRQHLYIADVDGSNMEELVPDLDRSIGSPKWSSDGRGIYFQYDNEGKTNLAYTTLSGNMKVVADSMSGLSIGRPYSGSMFAVGGRNTYAFTSGDALSPANISTGRGTGKPTTITDLGRNLLDSRAMAPVDEYWVKSSHDGLDIQYWVARPADFDPDNQYPLLLEIHGGPHTTYGPHFSAEVQLFASAGYVVVYANPRGSTSYGEEFAQTIHHNYPSEDYDDLMTVVDDVLRMGSIDTDQLYVTGGSGGGVLTAWIVGKTDRFRAAVVAKPVINWISFVLSADLPPFFTQYWFAKMPWEDPTDHWNRSPLSLVGNVTTPTMLLTGQEDWRTPMWESEQYYTALKLRGVETALVRVPGASHSIASRPSQLMAKVTSILAWFEKHSGKEAGD